MMSSSIFCQLTLLVLVLAGLNDGARILGLFPFPGKSHMISYSALTKELAAQGHEVTVVSSFPQNTPLPNYTDIVIEDTYPEKDKTNFFDMKNKNVLASFFEFWNIGVVTCDRAMGQESVQKLLHDKNLHFDLIITSVFMSECFNGFSHHFKAPTIHISPNTDIQVMGSMVGNPHTYSYIPDLMLGFSDHMTFTERMINSMAGTFLLLLRELYYFPMQETVLRKYFTDPDLPSLTELKSNSSLLLINSHLAFNSPRPFTPNTIEVGGMHIKPAKKLPKDLQQFMDSAPDGVVYFSLGSNVKSSGMPVALRDTILKAFSQLKQKVLWKWETDELPGQPKNVRLGKWLPQNDILGHPNVKLFITHGGLLSTQEAVYHGVPVLSIPVFGDQMINADKAQKAGYGLRLNFDEVTEENLLWSLDQLLNQRSYRDNVKRLSAVFHDQPEKPLERAVFWTEYVLRHKGASHMRSASLDLAWYQYHLLDVIGVLLGGTLVCLSVVFLTCRALCRCIRGEKRTNKNSTPTKKNKIH